jgi:HEAT repeat protein
MGDRTGRDVFIQVLSGEKSSSAGLLKGEVEVTKKKLQDPGKLAITGAKEAASSLFGPAGWGFKVMDEVTQDRSASARAMSAILLGSDATLDGLRELQDALSDKNWIVRAGAAQALGSSRHRDQIQHLRPLLQDDKPADRANSLKSEARPAFGPRGPNTSQ